MSIEERIRQKTINKGGQIMARTFSLLNEEEISYIQSQTTFYPECSLEQRIRMFLFKGDWPKCQLENCDNFCMIGKTNGFYISCGCSEEHTKRINAQRSAKTQKQNPKHTNPISEEETKKRKESLIQKGFIIKDVPIQTSRKWKFICSNCHSEFERTYYNADISKYSGLCQKCANIPSHQSLLIKENINEIKNKLQEKKLILLNEKPAFKQTDVIEVQCQACDTIFGRNRERLDQGGFICPTCFANSPRSVGECEIEDFIRELNIEVIPSYRQWSGFKEEIDVFCPEYNIGFEYNGLYYHSFPKKEKNFHQIKMMKAEEKGIRLIQIFEDEWEYKKELVKSKIKNLLNKNLERIFARHCKLSEISISEQKDFLNAYHIQGYKPSTIAKALIFENEIVALMTFVQNKLDRFCSSKKVLGGFSKLLASFSGMGEILTYCDLRWSSITNNIYLDSGFSSNGITQPGYFYVVSGKRVSRMKFQKHKLPLLFENVDMKKTEQEILIEHNIFPIYDAGHLRLKKII